MPRDLASPVSYTLEVRALQNVLRRTNKDKRLTPEEFAKVSAAVNEVTRILSDAQTRPMP
jgi:hypothetical protein